MKRILLIFPLIAIIVPSVAGQDCVPDDIHAEEDANAVCFEVDDNVRNFYSNNYPDHSDSYSSPFELSASDEEYSMCAYPEEAANFTPLYEETETTAGCTYNYAFGVGTNGVKYDPNSAEYFENTSTGENNIEWHVEARFLFRANFGNNGGHLNPFGEYHYHDVPSDYYADDLNIDGTVHSPIVGYAADGFPMYYKYVYSDPDDNESTVSELSSGYTLLTGSRPGDGISAPDGSYTGLYYEDYEYSDSGTELDECNGRFGVTPDYPFGTYYYVLTDNYPYIPRCFKGTYVDDTFRVGPSASCPSSSASTSCAEVISGCMDPFATNYNPSANLDDGSCTYTTCTTSVTASVQTNVTCKGGSDGSITLSVSGFGDTPTYTWSNGGSTATESDLSAGTYSVTVSGDNCSEDLEVTITEPDPITSTSTTTNSSCGGIDGTLTVTGAGGSGGTFQYSDDNGISFQTSGTFSDLAAGTYSILIQEITTNCEISLNVEITEEGAPDAPTVSSDAIYCDGEAIDALSVSGNGGTYTWYADEALSEVLVTGTSYTPSATLGTTTYYVTETASNCESAASSVTLIINETPTVAIANSASIICAGQNITLSASGAASYSWDKGVENGVAFKPSETTTYTVTGTDDNGCTGSAQITITVNGIPTISATSTAEEICIGESVTLTGSGATSYSWDNGVDNGVAFEPASTTTYTVTGTDTNGCSATAELTIIVNNPVVTVNASSETICIGESVILTGSGAQTYTWDGDVENGIAFEPVETATYTVTGTDDHGCMATAQITIEVNDLPEVDASASSQEVCAGESVTLIASGAQSYVWDNGAVDGQAFEPAQTTTYTVTGTGTNGCINTAQITIVVNDLPSVVATASNNEICVGESVTLTGSGAQTYTWSNEVVDGVAIQPTETTTYTVTGIDTKGCSATDQVTIIVNNPQVSVALVGSELVASLDEASYQWIDCSNNTAVSGQTSQSFTPDGSGSYAVTATLNGCEVTSECFDYVVSGLKDFLGLGVYPNPVKDQMTVAISLATGHQVELELVDLTGHRMNIVFLEQQDVYKFDLSGLTNGIYLLHITYNNREEWVRVVKE